MDGRGGAAVFSVAIDTELSLRLLEAGDAAGLFATINSCRQHLREWLPWVDDTRSSDDSAAFIRTGLEQLARGDGFQVGIEYCGELVGCIGLHGIDWNHRRTSLGYWLTADATGQGIMTRAVRAVVDSAFASYHLNRVELRAASGNQRSRAVAERLGFKQEGIIRDAEWLYDHFVDHVVYSVLEREWRAPDAGQR
jgi:ribosomal-protein-serine acetyltransferase